MKIKVTSLKSISTTKIIEALLFISFVVIEIGTFLLRSPFLLRNILLMAIGCLSILYSIAKRGVNHNRPFLNFVALYTICGIMSMFINHNADIQEILWPAAYMGMGLLLLNFKLPFRVAKWTFIIISITFCVVIVLAGGVDNLILQSSRNNISVYELQLWGVYMISAYQNKENAHFWSILLGLFISVISIGRGGILTFLVMLAIYMLFKYKKGQAQWAGAPIILLYSMLLVLAAVVLYSRYSDLVNQMISNLKLRGMETKRTLIWSDYFENVKSSILYVLFGAPQRGRYWLDKYSDNLHNSFLQLHAKYGLIMFCVVLISLFKRCISFCKEKQVYLFIPLIGMIIRMNLDYTNFNAMLDVILIFYILKPRFEKYKERIVHNEYNVL